MRPHENKSACPGIKRKCVGINLAWKHGVELVDHEDPALGSAHGIQGVVRGAAHISATQKWEAQIFNSLRLNEQTRNYIDAISVAHFKSKGTSV